MHAHDSGAGAHALSRRRSIDSEELRHLMSQGLDPREAMENKYKERGLSPPRPLEAGAPVTGQQKQRTHASNGSGTSNPTPRNVARVTKRPEGVPEPGTPTNTAQQQGSSAAAPKDTPASPPAASCKVCLYSFF